jgi:hypothetical protein
MSPPSPATAATAATAATRRSEITPLWQRLQCSCLARKVALQRLYNPTHDGGNVSHMCSTPVDEPFVVRAMVPASLFGERRPQVPDTRLAGGTISAGGRKHPTKQTAYFWLTESASGRTRLDWWSVFACLASRHCAARKPTVQHGLSWPSLINRLWFDVHTKTCSTSIAPVSDLRCCSHWASRHAKWRALLRTRHAAPVCRADQGAFHGDVSLRSTPSVV